MPLSRQHKTLLQESFRRRLNLRALTNAVRLVNSKADGLDGLVLEQYHRHFVVQAFLRPWVDAAGELMAFLKDHFPVDYFIVKDRSQNPLSFKTKVLASFESSKTRVNEFGVQVEVDLNDGLNSGLFLDMRHNRRMVAQASAGKKVLNCFAYTCCFGLHARCCAAKQVINVDINKKALEKGRQNYQLNRIEPGDLEFVKAEASSFLQRARKKRNCFDVIILDPPSFSRSHEKIFNVKKDLPEVLQTAVACLTPNGKLFVSTNFSGLSYQDLNRMVRQASGPRLLKSCTAWGQDTDFPPNPKAKESHLAALWAEIL